MQKHTSVFFLALPLLFLSACSCSTLKKVDRQPSVRLSAQARNEALSGSGKVKALFDKEGHQLTTFIVATLAGLPENEVYTLTYYSQYPDLDMKYDAVCVGIKYLFACWNWDWRKGVMAGLHSLHGGDANKIKARRIHLANLIKGRLAQNQPEGYRDAGLLIHSFGDSFAHTKGCYLCPEETAYCYFLGHALEIENPDQMAYAKVFPKYEAYVRLLYDVISSHTKQPANPELDDFLLHLQQLVCTTGDDCSEKIDLMKGEILRFARDKAHYQASILSQFDSMQRLPKKTIQSIIDDICQDP
jgi:hypothetical protein